MSQLKDDIVQDVCTASHPVLRPGPVFRVSCFIWMAYLSLRIMLCPLTPSRVLLVGRACCWDRRQASEWRNAAVKCIWGTAGEGSESVWSLESLRVLFHGQIHTHTHMYNHSHIPSNLLPLLSHTHSLGQTCLTQCIWKQSHPASHDKNNLLLKWK